MSVVRLLLIVVLVVVVAACQPVRPEAEVAAEATALAQEEGAPTAVAEEEMTPTAVAEEEDAEATPTPMAEEEEAEATPTAQPEEEATATPEAEAADPKTVVEEFFAALNARDGATAAKLMIDRRPLHSAAATARRAFLANTPVVEARTFPDFQYIPHVAIADGDTVAIYLTFTGTQEGPFGNRAATGRPMAVDVLMFNRVEDGKIVESWAEWDNVAQLAQLGHLPPELSPPDPEAVPVYPTLGEGDPEANTEIVLQYMEAVNNGDDAGMAALLAPNAARYSQSDPGLHGRSAEEIIAIDQGERAAFPDRHYEVEEVVAEGDLVAGWGTLTGTNTGPLGDGPATGAALEIPVGAVFRVEDGKIAELWLVLDNLSFYSQLGLLPEE